MRRFTSLAIAAARPASPANAAPARAGQRDLALPRASSPAGLQPFGRALRRASVVGAWALLAALAFDAAAAQEPAPPELPPADTTGLDDPPRSPRGAFLRSLVLPGWGHAWVGAPGRGGVYFALEAGALWMTYKSHQRLRDARVQERWLRDTGQLTAEQPFALTRAREDQVEDWLTLAIFILFFSGADAFVAAHLADFGGTVGALPGPGGALRLEASIPVGGPR